MAISVHPEPAPAPGGDAVADEELVGAVRQGSDPAFEQLYRRYHRRIAAFVYGKVADYGRAEDITQEVFISALRRMRATERPIAFKPWIYEIAKNACIDQYRRSRRADEISYDAEEGLGAAARVRLATTAPSPHAQLDQKAALENLRGAFGGLSPVHHEILVLREFEGLSYREIGERLDMSRASVESTLFRARRRLTEEYDELVSGERCGRVQGLIATAEVARPGLRDQRRLRAHLSHCQPCRRSARLAGLDDALFVAPRGVRAKVAAFFPLPAFLQRRWGGASSPVPSGRGATLAQLTAQYGTSVDPYVGTSWTKAAAAAATLAVAGVAGGHAVSDGSHELFGGATPQRNEASSPRSLATSGPRAASGSATGAATPVVRSSGAAPGSGAATPPARRSSGPSERGGPKRAGTAPTRAAAAASPAPVASAAQPQAAVGALMPKVAVPSTPPATKPAADSDVALGAAKAAGKKAASGTKEVVSGATIAGADVLPGLTETGNGATGETIPVAPLAPPTSAAPLIPASPALPIAPATPGLGG